MVNARVYIINYDRLVLWFIPLLQRKTVHVAWLRVLIASVKRLHTEFLSFRGESVYKLSHNSQVVLMQKMLNDAFDTIERRIIIRNSIIHDPVWFYKKASAKPVYFYKPPETDADTDKPVLFYKKSTVNQADADFVVEVPLSMKPAVSNEFKQFEALMRAKIDYYKLYSKSYTIIYV